MYIASTLGEVDKMAVPQFEEQKLCLPASLAQFQITLFSFLAPTVALIVLMFYYSISKVRGHFLRFRAFLPIYLVFLFEN